MALIGMAVFSTNENKKDVCLSKTLLSLFHTVDFDRHRIVLSVNAQTEKTKIVIDSHRHWLHDVIYNGENIGTARAINKAWAMREPGEHCIKMDDDVVIHQDGWLDQLEEAVARDPRIGQIGLKRKDVWEHPKHESADLRSELIMLPHTGGETWIVVEKVKHVIGTCVLHSSALLDKVGFLYQPSQYGYDDVIMSHRTHLAGMYSCFLPHVPIDHIDDGLTPYQDWKHRHSGEQTQNVINLVHEMYNGTKSIFYSQY